MGTKKLLSANKMENLDVEDNVSHVSPTPSLLEVEDIGDTTTTANSPRQYAKSTPLQIGGRRAQYDQWRTQSNGNGTTHDSISGGQTVTPTSNASFIDEDGFSRVYTKFQKHNWRKKQRKEKQRQNL